MPDRPLPDSRPLRRRVAGLAMLLAWAGASVADQGPVPIREGAIQIRPVECGAWLTETFDGAEPNLTIWRVWHSDPARVGLRVAGGRFELTATGAIGHNGLWQLAATKYKDVVLVARLDARTEGPDPHPLALHLCGGDGSHSPDHWTELLMYDQGDQARFSYWSTAPNGAFTFDAASERVLDRTATEGFLAKVEMDGSSNLATTWVHDGRRWQQVGPAVELLLRTVHCEVKLRGGAPPRGPGETRTTGWFDDVRLYPRPRSHPVGVRLVREDGSPIWSRGAAEAWPPKIRLGDGPERSIEDLSVELWTADGATRVAAVRSQNMGYYMLPLKDAPWDVYPVSARLRVVVDGRPLGQDQLVQVDGLKGLYPDDVWDVVMR